MRWFKFNVIVIVSMNLWLLPINNYGKLYIEKFGEATNRSNVYVRKSLLRYPLEIITFFGLYE